MATSAGQAEGETYALLFGSGFIADVMSLQHVDPEAVRTDHEIWTIELLEEQVMQTDATSSVAAQTRAGSVVALWRYPVKSMMGEELNSSRKCLTVGCSGTGSSPLWTEPPARSGELKIRGSGATSLTFGQLCRSSETRRTDFRGSDHAS